MASTLGHALAHYAALAAVLVPCWGIGHLALSRLPGAQRPEPGLGTPLATALGLGVAICVLQALAVAGMLWKSAVLIAWAVGSAIAVWQLVRVWRTRKPPASPGAQNPVTFPERCGFAMLALAIASTVMRPLWPPLAWDELMYHLPHAQQWAESGRLQVNLWLRYPWFPYNYDLLYAAALLFGNDILPHLLHAAAGWLVAWLVYGLGARHLDRLTGCVAAVIWILLSRSEYDRAYIDLAVALFVLVAGIAFARWWHEGARTWLAVSAFSMGIALGTKYQVLGLLPFFVVAMAWRDRRPSTWLIATAALAVPCIYWYARNAIVTGDPVNPIGGRWFGFTDWDLGDYKAQFDDLRRHVGAPPWMLWSAVLAPFIPAVRASRAARGALMLCAWMLAVWLISSRYPRYLIPAYPMLALLAAAVWVHVLRKLPVHAWSPRLQQTLRVSVLALIGGLGVAACTSGAKHAQRIASTPEARDALLRQEVTGYGMWRHLRAQPAGRIYQLGVEDSLYYAPQPVWGEVFGPWRYRDVQSLAPEAMHRKLSADGFDALVIHTGRAPGVTSQPGFTRWFSLIHSDGDVQLYRLAQNSPP